jgi:hypothetical protein
MAKFHSRPRRQMNLDDLGLSAEGDARAFALALAAVTHECDLRGAVAADQSPPGMSTISGFRWKVLLPTLLARSQQYGVKTRIGIRHRGQHCDQPIGQDLRRRGMFCVGSAEIAFAAPRWSQTERGPTDAQDIR